MSRPATRAQARALVRGLARDRPGPIFVGIDGPGGAGKSTLARYLADGLARAVIVGTDDFSGPQIQAWDWDRFLAQVVTPLQAGRPGRYLRWDWAADAGGEWRDVPVGSLVLVEGVSATRAEVSVDWALRIWVDTAPELRRQRVLARDGPDRQQLWARWRRSEQAYFAAQHPRDQADLIVRGD